MMMKNLNSYNKKKIKINYKKKMLCRNKSFSNMKISKIAIRIALINWHRLINIRVCKIAAKMINININNNNNNNK